MCIYNFLRVLSKKHWYISLTCLLHFCLQACQPAWPLQYIPVFYSKKGRWEHHVWHRRHYGLPLMLHDISHNQLRLSCSRRSMRRTFAYRQGRRGTHSNIWMPTQTYAWFFFVRAHTFSPQQQYVFLTHSIVREISIAPTVSFQWIFSEKDTHEAETTCCGKKIGKEKKRAGRRDRLNRCKYCTQRGQTEKPVSSTWRRLCESRNI